MRALPWISEAQDVQPELEVEITLIQTPESRLQPGSSVAFSLSAVSERLHRHWQCARYCDCNLRVDASQVQIGAHQVVLSRNPHLSSNISEIIYVPAGVSDEGLREVLRAHYLEDEVESWRNRAADKVLQELRAKLSRQEWDLLEVVFGPLQIENWRSLSDTLRDDASYCDCRLQLGDGSALFAHRSMLASADGSEYISSALSWPRAEEDTKLPVDLQMPPDFSAEALRALLDLRYGRARPDTESLLECAHFADFLGWSDATKTIHQQLLEVLQRKSNIDPDSALAVFVYCADSFVAASLPQKLRELAYSCALRWFVAASDEAKRGIPVQARARLHLLSKIRNRFGHICEDIQDYLHACGDDLLEWETSLGPNAPNSARIALDNQWEHWNAMVTELGRMDGASNTSEAWRSRLLERRCAARQTVRA